MTSMRQLSRDIQVKPRDVYILFLDNAQVSSYL